MTKYTRTHKASGWTREPIGYGRFTIMPTDASGTREVMFLSAGSWQNLPNDDRANIDRDRVILVSGEPLPEWAQTWLEQANARSCENGREGLRAAIDDADANYFGRDSGW
jgi:hypothetical protein